MKLSILLLSVFVGLGCTCRDVSYKGVTYSHKSFGVKQSFGKLSIGIDTNGSASVEIENFSNDQVSVMREANKLLENARALKP